MSFPQEVASLRLRLLSSLIAAESLASFWEHLTSLLAGMVPYDAALMWADFLNDDKRPILLGTTCDGCSVPAVGGDGPLEDCRGPSSNCGLPAALVRSRSLASRFRQGTAYVDASETPIVIVLPLTDQRLAVLILCNGSRGSELKQDERVEIERLCPFIAVTLLRLLNQDRQVAVNTMALRFLNDSPVGVILLDGGLQTSFVNREGYRMAQFWAQGTTRSWASEQRESFRMPPDLYQICRKLLEEWKRSLHQHRTWEPPAERVVNKNDRNMQATVRIKSGPGGRYPGLLVQFEHLASPDYETFKPNQKQLRILALLSPAERRVAILASHGLGNAQIASRLFIQRSTVKDHLSRIYEKLNIDGRAYLARLLSYPADNADGPSQGI
jgi:DNA-binding CsgD family transcriptional regulator